MRPTPRIPTVLLLALTAACASSTRWRGDEALDADSVELQVDARGHALEIEYHVSPAVVPAAVRQAMDELHPRGEATGAEKEYVGRTLFWELTKEIDGREIEAMFLPDGTLHSEEIEVPSASVPGAVKAAVARRLGGEITKWEEIRDGAKRLVEYHAKVASAGRKYKVRAGLDGAVLGVVREVEAEIEVPVPSS